MLNYIRLIKIRCSLILDNFLQLPKNNFGLCPIVPVPLNSTTNSLSDFFDSILWAAVPKNRRSRERRATRRFGFHKIKEYMTPKKNIVECLQCGYYHESHTICGVCYKKVKDETEFLKSLIPEENKYKPCNQEILYRYSNEYTSADKNFVNQTQIINNVSSENDSLLNSTEEGSDKNGDIDLEMRLQKDVRNKNLIIEVPKERPSWFPKKLLSKYDVKD